MNDFTQLPNDIYSDIVFAPNEIGTPFEDATYAPGPQERMDSCAIRAQQHVLSMFGIDVSETDLANDAVRHGEYSENDMYGTSISNVGNLLERNGVDVHRYEGATLAHLISELGQGHKIIVAVDANEIAASSPGETLIEHMKDAIQEVPNHAVVVSNIDPNTLDVDIVDPADGELHRISASTFVDAWHDSNCFMVSTNSAPKEFNAEAVNITDSALNNGPIRLIDLDGDGLTDIIGFDYNGDGRIDEYFVDFDHDGIPDMGKGGFTSLSKLGVAFGNQLPQSSNLQHAVEENMEATISKFDHANQTNMTQLGGAGHIAGMSVLGEGMYGFDINGDGIADVTISCNGSGPIPTTMAIDLNGDGIPDVNGSVIDMGRSDVVGLDIDGDGIADMVINLE